MVVLFLVFAIYGIVTFDLSIQEMIKLQSSRNEAVAVNMIQDLDQRIENRLSDFKELTKIPEIQEALIESNQKFSQLENISVYIISKEQGIVYKVDSEIPPFMAEVINLRLSRELRDTIDFYRDEYNFDVVKEMYVTNAYGANIALGSGVSYYSPVEEEWWTQAKDTGSFYGKLEHHQDYDSQVMGFGFRIDDPDGNMLGVMRVLVSVEDLLADVVEEAEIVNNQNRNVVLLDDIGRILFSNGIQDPTNTEPVPYFQEILDGKNLGVIELSESDEEIRFISYARSTGYKTFEGFDWTVIIEQNSSSIVEEFVDLRNSILAISLFGMIISVVIGITISKLVSNPLKNLSKMAKSISKGDFKVTARKSRISEIDTIGQSFNKMAKSLEQLIETEKKLAEANVRVKNERFTAIGELAASVAHDLKNPLATIRSSADIVKRTSGNKDEELDKVLARMNRAIARMSHQIEGVLNYVRLTPINPTKISVNALLEGALDTLEIPNNIKLNLPEKEIEIICDQKKMEIVFINLLLNAQQAIGKQDGEINVRVKDEKEFYEIEFENSGEPISEKIMPKMFEPLVTSKEKGTGLGLSSCKNIIEQHGGTITAKNNPTTFTIKIPKKLEIDE